MIIDTNSFCQDNKNYIINIKTHQKIIVALLFHIDISYDQSDRNPLNPIMLNVSFVLKNVNNQVNVKHPVSIIIVVEKNIVM